MNNPFDYQPDQEARKAFSEMLADIETLRGSSDPLHKAFIRELDSGKMLGVLIAEDAEGRHHTLRAFSGQIGSEGFLFPGFVGPVFDYLDPLGYFKTHEAMISAQNRAIAAYEAEVVSEAERIRSQIHEEGKKKIEAYRLQCQQSKARRDAHRLRGMLTPEEEARMIRESQFEKAEFHRIKKRVAAETEPYEVAYKAARSRLDEMKAQRKTDSEALQNWLFSQFRMLNAEGDFRSLPEIFSTTAFKVPPSGAGECCAPKLLQAAYKRGLHPLSIAEYWYGAPKGGELRQHGQYYPACRGKCLPILGWMLRGLEIYPPLGNEAGNTVAHTPQIVAENEWFCVVDKPSGMLSVPGRTGEESVEDWLRQYYGAGKWVKMVHRLDQDTSGLIIGAFTTEAHRELQYLFSTRRMHKTYIADLDGDYRKAGIPPQGRIDLAIAPDILDRPRQRVDPENGKTAVTEYEFIGYEDGRSRVRFSPLTGRTHQLRVHSASAAGLGMPIIGDRLYGHRDNGEGSRMHLHARTLEFTSPFDGTEHHFESAVPF